LTPAICNCLYDSILGYDEVLDRFFPVQSSGEFLLGISQSGITLEALDALAPTPLTITGAADNGSGAIRLTLDAETNSDFTVLGQNSIVVYGVGGTTEANGTWAFTVVDDTNIDLIGSTFTNAYTSGGQIGGSLDAMVLSLDDYPTSFEPRLGQFDNNHQLGFFSGVALEGTIDSAEESGDGTRLTARGFVPLTDATGVQCCYAYRDTLQATPTVGASAGVSARTGRFDQMRDARFIRFRTTIPAGTNWTFYSGVDSDVIAGGAI
jgi:hypothetical protein